MKTLTTLPAPSSTVSLKTLLTEEGVSCHVAEVTGNEQLPLGAECRRLIFVLQGEITCVRGAVNTIVNQEEALLLSNKRTSLLQARNGESARLLVVDLPNPLQEPDIRTFDR